MTPRRSRADHAAVPALPLDLPLLTAVVALVLFGAAVWHAPWKKWLEGHADRQHVWGIGLLLTAVLASLRVEAAPGLALQLLFVTTMTLMHGWALALIANGLVLAGSCLFRGLDLWTTWPTLFLCDVVLRALFISLLNRLLQRRLPRHFAVYFFGTVFAGSIAAFVLSGLAKLVLVAMAGTLPAATVLGDYLVLLPMMGFAQGTINGMIMSGAVVFHPEWVKSFDSDVYFRR